MANRVVLAAGNRRKLRVLRMVHELHKLGYQRIRVVPGMASTGLHWRCDVTHAANISSEHGAKLAHDRDLAVYSSGQDNAYFGWTDAKQDHAYELADKFVVRFPDIARLGQGLDWAYAGWFVQMLGFAERGEFPLAYTDDGYIPCRGGCLPTTKGDESGLPMPPPGEASGR